MRFAAANITKGRLIAEALGWLTLGGVAAFLAETMRLYQQSQWERTHGADVAFVLISVLLPAVVAIAAICTSAVKLHQFLTALFRRQIPPFDMPPIPRVDGPEPPGGAPVPARVPPKKPAPLAAHAVAVVEE